MFLLRSPAAVAVVARVLRFCQMSTVLKTTRGTARPGLVSTTTAIVLYTRADNFDQQSALPPTPSTAALFTPDAGMILAVVPHMA
jgi:hypothetical protein